ncbi:MAG: hypothetical protein A3F43_04225 [Gammaproteobacteria bacterium RIFCSPHIGHO2_12_FULL_42_10]|nr:MAG: hypothetical protein A3F43_04225 [Gammaproteobacteria bacterium RIFCSPHIGHO2_12_FULL_42_10]
MYYIHAFAITVLLLVTIQYVLTAYIFPKKAKKTLENQLKNHPNYKRLKKIEALFNQLYKRSYANFSSYSDRKNFNIKSNEFIYGEIDFLSFFSILKKTNPQPGEVFYDLGSGSGKAVFAAALCFELSESLGIELLPALFKKSNRQLERVKTLILHHDRDFSDTYLARIASIHFFNENILHHDYSNADILYIAATCFSEETWNKLIAQFACLKSGTRIIVTSKSIHNQQFVSIHSHAELMSWGLCTVNIYKKI